MCLNLIFMIYNIRKADNFKSIIGFCGFLLCFLSLGIAIYSNALTEKQEFPASEYTLEYKITTIGEKSDTVYVLIKKE